MESLLTRLKQRKLFQWGLVYVAGSWLIAQVLDVVAEPWGLPGGSERAVQALLALGFPVALVLAWYHGEKGRQRVSGPEFVILTSLVMLVGVALAVFNPLSEIEPVAEEASLVDPNSIVVLPFRDMSADGDQDYMSEGIAEELLNLLAQIPELKVISRTTAFSFKNRDDVTVPEIAAQLEVAHVLQGSVRTEGNSIRITAQLIDTRSDTRVFSRNYDGALEDIFALQDAIAARVASALKLTMLGALPTLRETKPQAYTLFLRARRIADAISKENYETAIPMFERVLEIDSEYAPAYVELAVAYMDQAKSDWRPYDEGIQMSLDAAERAVSLDEHFAYARAVFGASMVELGDTAGGLRHIELAVEMSPTDPEVLMEAALQLEYLGRFDDAIAVYEYVEERDPLYEVNLQNLAGAYYRAWRHEDAAATYRTILDLNPGAHHDLGLVLIELGQYEEALAVAESITVPPARLGLLALANHKLGRDTEFERVFRELEDEWGEAVPSLVAAGHAVMGDMDAAFEWLDRVPSLQAAALDSFHPLLADLHLDPRWPAFQERMGQSRERLAAIQFEVRVPR